MDDINQELEFLDLSDLPENEVQNLRSYIGGLTSHECVKDDVALPLERQVSEPIEGFGETFEEPGVTLTFPPNLDMVGPVSVGYPTPNSVHPSLYQQNVCITPMPQYPMGYQMQMLSGAHPNFFVPHPAPFTPPPPIMNPPIAGYHKRKNVRPKYPPRKDVINGNVDGYSNLVYQPTPPPPFMGPCFSGDVVQAVTGVPIVMHQSVPSYVPPQNVQVSAASTTQVYPMVTFAPAVPAVPVPIDVFTPQVDESVPPPVDVSSISVSLPTSVVVQTEKSQQLETAVPPEVPAPVISEEKPPRTTDNSESKSWASLFKPTPAVINHEKPTARVEPFTPSGGAVLAETSQAVSRPLVDVRIRRLAEHLETHCDLVTTPLALLPRGLINKSNWCYINATLQALIACAPFVHLIKSLTPFAGGRNEDSSTPILDSVIEFIDQFEVVPVRTGKERSSAKKEEPHFGTSFEPSSVYKMLSKIRSETFKVEGRQEDAEEFLSCLLNGLHDEMLDALKSTREDNKVPVQLPEPKPGASDDEDWQEVIDHKNRGCVTHTTSYDKTPVSNLFLGQMRSALHYTGAQSATATLQPFFSLQLDIQNEKVNSVRDALACLVSKEPLTGYVCSKTGQEVEASRQTTLAELPPVLILHLKCFVYDKSGGCQKLLKRVEFSADLELSKDFLSPMPKGKLRERQRQYKLFAVVYHDGKEATKGHYVTEVHHSGTGNWLRFDDSIIRVVDTQLFKYNLPRMPYLLLYRKVNV